MHFILEFRKYKSLFTIASFESDEYFHQIFLDTLNLSGVPSKRNWKAITHHLKSCFQKGFIYPSLITEKEEEINNIISSKTNGHDSSGGSSIDVKFPIVPAHHPLHNYFIADFTFNGFPTTAKKYKCLIPKDLFEKMYTQSKDTILVAKCQKDGYKNSKHHYKDVEYIFSLGSREYTKKCCILFETKKKHAPRLLTAIDYNNHRYTKTYTAVINFCPRLFYTFIAYAYLLFGPSKNSFYGYTHTVETYFINCTGYRAFISHD